ncbi:hypothetical protein GCM10010124_27410 [Pilimelia terevasa]|uniref:Fibronectin type-III domain-containing protein n=1 Tax=Pilimelia terevasa TaxID=53372 RepID=A0A8J3FKG2_9ACTN|nr:Ig-like domain-containing protein [Pilimelia terevasa]GGK33200.1 hypothetical protein GCM10010124_27410 [Pilimelia terevasa]
MGSHILLGKRALALASAAALAVLVGPLPASAALPVVGPVNNVTGYPMYVEDSAGTRLAMCDDPAQGCAMSELPDLGKPMSYPDNYAVENFYFAASATLAGAVNGTFVIALESTYVNEAVVPGQEALFTRIRLDKVDGLQPNQTYTVTHPYGDFTITADGDGQVKRGFHTADVGCFSPTEGDPAADPASCMNDGWKRATNAFAGDQGGAGNAAPFLSWDPAVAPAAPAGHLGDVNVAHKVTGSTLVDATGAPQNYLRISGPGVDTRTDLWNLQGRLAEVNAGNPPTAPNLDDASDTGWSMLDNVTNDNTPTFSGRASGASVDLMEGDTVLGTADVAAGKFSVTVAADKALADGAHVLKVRSGDDSSAPTTVTVDTAAPAAPGAPVATATSNSTARLTWNGVAGAERYTVFRDDVAVANRIAGDIGEGGDASVGGLYGKVSRVQLSATDEAGNTSGRSVARKVGIPGAVKATAAHGSTADKVVNTKVTWTTAVNNSAAVTGYRVTSYENRTGRKITKVVKPNLRYLYFTGLKKNVKYRFVVQAVNKFGTAPASPYSGWATAR